MLTSYGWPYPFYCEKFPDLLSKELTRAAGKKAMRGLKSAKVKSIVAEMMFALMKDGFRVRSSAMDKLMVGHFDGHRKELRRFWLRHPLLARSDVVIRDILATYKKKYWSACICTTFPLIDRALRALLKTKRFERQVTQVLGLMKTAGITSSDLKPGYVAWQRAATKKSDKKEDATKSDFRLVGIALGSFVDFGSQYYKYFRKEPRTGAPPLYSLNRHAILHGAVTDCWTRTNAVRVMSFLDLVLRLEPALQILLRED
jgi:hypothetical protein